MSAALMNLKRLRELVRLALAAHGGFHGGTGKPLADYAAAGCASCEAITAADEAAQTLEGRPLKPAACNCMEKHHGAQEFDEHAPECASVRTVRPKLIDLNLSGGRPQS